MGEPKKVHPLVSVRPPLPVDQLLEREILSLRDLEDCVAFRGGQLSAYYAEQAAAKAESAIRTAAAADALTGATQLTMIFLAGRYALQAKVYAAAASDAPAGNVVQAIEGRQ